MVSNLDQECRLLGPTDDRHAGNDGRDFGNVHALLLRAHVEDEKVGREYRSGISTYPDTKDYVSPLISSLEGVDQLGGD